MGDPISRIEIQFAVPVALTDQEERTIAELVDAIARRNTPDGCVHWLSGIGAKPQFSQADARFLGKPVDPTAPEAGEPTFDASTLYFETSCRER